MNATKKDMSVRDKILIIILRSFCAIAVFFLLMDFVGLGQAITTSIALFSVGAANACEAILKWRDNKKISVICIIVSVLFFHNGALLLYFFA